MRLLEEIRSILNKHSVSEEDVLWVQYFLKNQNHEGEEWEQHWCTWGEWVNCAKDYGERRYLVNHIAFIGERFKLFRQYSSHWDGLGGQCVHIEWSLVRIPPKPAQSQHRLPLYVER